MDALPYPWEEKRPALKLKPELVQPWAADTPTVAAPIAAGQVVGSAVAILDGRELGAVDILCSEEVPKGSFWDRLFH